MSEAGKPVKARTARKKSSGGKDGESSRADMFYSDGEAEGMLYGAIVRSPYAHGKIASLVIDLPDGYRLFTARDIPGKNEIRTLNTTTKIFCADEVHYIGEPIGIIAGPDLRTARSLARDVKITFDAGTIKEAAKKLNAEYRRPAVKFPEKIPPLKVEGLLKCSLAEGGAQMRKTDGAENFFAAADAPLHEPFGAGGGKRQAEPRVIAERIVRTGIFHAAEDGTCALSDAEKFYSSCDFDIATTASLFEPPVEWAEPSGAFCLPKGQKITVMTATEWPEHLRAALIGALGIDGGRIIVKKTKEQPSGANGLWRCTALAVQTAIAAYLCGKPVKLILTRDEQADFMEAGLPASLTYRSAVTADGTIRAMKVHIDADAGAVNPFAPEIADRLAVAAAGLYNVENLFISARLHATDTPPSSIDHERADAAVFFALENHMQAIAERTGLLPDEIRRINMPTADCVQKSPFAFKIPKADTAIQASLTQSGFKRKYASFRMPKIPEKSKAAAQTYDAFENLPLRGIGLSCAYGGSCFLGSMFNACAQKLEVTLTGEGTLVIKAAEPSETVALIWKKIASELLELPSESVKIEPEGEGRTEVGIPENFCNNISIMTMLLRRCCSEIQKKRFHSPLPITSKKAVTPAMKKQWNAAAFAGSPFYGAAFGAAAVELELNADTFKECVKGIWLVIDCGEIFSVKAAENAVRLSVRQELESLMEDSSVGCSSIFVSFIQSNRPPCQINRIVHSLIPAAFACAASQALGEPLTKLPCTKEMFFELLQ
ncbi:MAG: xanthine dehydrogenase family protein molybdopterin-binding subunit, partial [Treponema sp.]